MNEKEILRELSKFWKSTKRVPNIPGDDALFIKENTGKILSLSIDCSIEGTHFNRELLTMKEVGYRSMAGALSDLAAKGSSPLTALVDMHINQGVSKRDINELYRGFEECCNIFNCTIGGGNIAYSDCFSISISVVGESLNVVERDKSKEGDNIYVTGDIGRVAGFFKLVKDNADIPESILTKFKHPIPRFTEMQKILKITDVHASIDISDGLGIDLGRMADMSNTDMFVYFDKIPVHPSMHIFSREELYELVVSSGEEYEIAFTAPVNASIPISLAKEIGKVKKGNGRVFLKAEDRLKEISNAGFLHGNKKPF